MIVVDTSAIMAILLKEEERSVFFNALSRRDACMSWVNIVEVHIMSLRRRGQGLCVKARQLIDELDIQPVPVDAAHADRAMRAYQDFGKGRHDARLNFGDCFAYALAREMDAPLLFKGDDFAKTDITSCI